MRFAIGKLKEKELILIAFVVLSSFVVTLYCQYCFLRDRYAFPEDARESIIWMYDLHDKELFKDDLYLKYENWKTPLGLKLFYYVVFLALNPITAVKIMPFFLCMILAVYSARIGFLLRNKITGLFLAVLMCFIAWYKDFTWFKMGTVWFNESGAGDFHPVLLVIFLFYFLKKDHFKSALVMIAQLLFYPPAFLICFGAFLIDYIFRLKNKTVAPKEKKELLWLVGLLIAAAVFIGFKYANTPKKLGNPYTQDEMKKMEEFYPGGRTPMFFTSFYEQIANGRSGMELNDIKISLVLISFVCIILLGKKEICISQELLAFLASGFFMFFLSNLLLLKLFEPSRYLRYVLPVFLVVFSMSNLDKLIFRLKSKNKKWIYAFLGIVIFAFFAPNLQSIFNTGSSQKADEKLYKFIAALPKNSLLAGHPEVMDNIPAFSKQRVFIMQEGAFPYLKGFYETVKNRTYDFFNAYYSCKKSQVYEFCKKNNIDYMVVRRKDFTKDYLEKGKFYFSPFNRHIAELVKKENFDKFALLNMPRQRIIFEDEKYFIVACNQGQNG